MRTLLPELKRVFKIAPLGIALVLILDVLEIVLVSLRPVVIGSCIDTLFERKYFWLYILIALQLLLILARFVNKTADTRVYERIIKDESDTYYETAIQTIGNDSAISSRRCWPNRSLPYLYLFLFWIDPVPISCYSFCFDMLSYKGFAQRNSREQC